MPFWKTYYHLVWATSNRQPLIQPEFEAQLFAYLVKKAGEMGFSSMLWMDGWTMFI